MDRYGLTEEEKRLDLHEYNHALFRNMKGFMDASWEINMRTGKIVAIYDKVFPEFVEKQFEYDTFYREYAVQNIYHADQEKWLDVLNRQALQKLEEEISLDIHIMGKTGIPEKYHIVITPAKDEDGVIQRVYIGLKNMEVKLNHELQMLGKEEISQKILDLNKELEEHNKKLHNTLSQEEQYRRAIVSGAIYVYHINVSQNLIEDEFFEMVNGKQIPMIKYIGLSVPCDFNLFSKTWAEKNIPPEEREEYVRVFNNENLLKCYEEGRREIVHECHTKEGRNIDIVLRYTMLLTKVESGDIIALCNGKDVTEQRARENETIKALQQAVESANQANNAKSDFLSRMSHDIRTPLNAIIGMTAIAQTHLDNADKLSECLDMIEMSSDHLLLLLNEILDMSKIESGKFVLNEEEFNVAELIDNMVRMARSYTEEKKHHFHVNVGRIEHEMVIGDSLRIQQVVVNLISNAVKYTPEGGDITLSICERPLPGMKKGYYEFVVEDSGIGISEDFLEHIFDPFTREKDTRINEIQGTGLGMSITKNIVTMMDGNMKVESEPNKGSRFTFGIQLKLQELVNMDRDEFVGNSVLVVGNEEADCKRLCVTLADIGLQGEWVYSGEEALQKLAAVKEEGREYLAVMVDWKMKGMSGVETTKAIRREFGDELSVVVMSAYDLSDIEIKARAVGADAFASKPLLKSRLIQLFRTLCKKEQKMKKNKLASLRERKFPGKRVLVVEDNEINAQITIQILSMAEMEVEWAKNGKEAVEMVEKSAHKYYDMVFMDIQMPIMNGNEATRAIRALPRDDVNGLPIVAMTANAFAQDVQAALSAGMNEHIAKPLNMDRLFESLVRWL